MLAAEPDEPELWKVLKNRKCGSAPRGDGKVVDFYKAMCAPLEGGSGRGLTKLLEVVQRIWRCEKVEESWLVGKLRLLPKSGDLSIPNNWRGITLAVIAKLFCSSSQIESQTSIFCPRQRKLVVVFVTALIRQNTKSTGTLPIVSPSIALPVHPESSSGVSKRPLRDH